MGRFFFLAHLFFKASQASLKLWFEVWHVLSSLKLTASLPPKSGWLEDDFISFLRPRWPIFQGQTTHSLLMCFRVQVKTPRENLAVRLVREGWVLPRGRGHSPELWCHVSFQCGGHGCGQARLDVWGRDPRGNCGVSRRFGGMGWWELSHRSKVYTRAPTRSLG